MMNKKKFFKYLKYIIIIWLSLTVLIFVGGVIKYNIDLNQYLNQEVPKKAITTHNPSSQEAEVYVLGTVHFETNKIKRDDFYHYLDSISPAFILYESDTKTVNKILKRTDFFRQLMSTFKSENAVEGFISLKYLKYHPESSILPYEWEERDSYQFKNSLSSKSNELINSVIRLNRENLLSSKQSQDVKEFLELNKEYYKISRNAKTIEDFNNETTDSLIKKRQLYVYKYLPEIVKERKELAQFDDFIPIHMNYWDTRNKAMVNNIVNQIKLNPNKKIVVLTGYTHRYYLIDELKKHQIELNFSIK